MAKRCKTWDMRVTNIHHSHYWIPKDCLCMRVCVGGRYGNQFSNSQFNPIFGVILVLESSGTWLGQNNNFESLKLFFDKQVLNWILFGYRTESNWTLRSIQDICNLIVLCLPVCTPHIFIVDASIFSSHLSPYMWTETWIIFYFWLFVSVLKFSSCVRLCLPISRNWILSVCSSTSYDERNIQDRTIQSTMSLLNGATMERFLLPI